MSAMKCVIVGAKPALSYVTACITIFNQGEKEVIIRARGKAINTAVESVRMLQNHFIKGLKIKDVRIDGEMIVTNEGKKRTVPVLELVLSKESVVHK